MPIVLEVALVFSAVESLVWVPDSLRQFRWLGVGLLFLSVIYSWYRRGDTPQSLGLAPHNWKKDLFSISFSFAVLWRAVMLVAEIWNPAAIAHPNLRGVVTHIGQYYIWALFQQLCVNGYFTNRIQTIVGENKNCRVAIIVGILFGLAHLPNPVLVVVTSIGGGLGSYFFQRNKNLYYLAIGHALLAVSISHFLPDAWHHNLRVGPGYWSWGK